MREPGQLIHDAAYALTFHTLEPRPDPPRTLLLLLHGVGGDEHQWVRLGMQVPDDTLVVLPRGPRSISGERIGWFREGLSADGPQVVEEEAEDARLKLLQFISQLQSRFDIAPSRTVVAGFSQGGMLAASVALTAPECIAGFGVVCGRLMPELEPRLAPADGLRKLDALIIHGRGDETLPVEWAERAAGWLAQLGVTHEVQLHDAGHELAAAMEADLLHWFNAPERSWNHTAGR